MFHGVIHKITLAQFFETRCIAEYSAGINDFGVVSPRLTENSYTITVLKQESCAIVKMTARCALYMSASHHVMMFLHSRLESSSTVSSPPHLLSLQNFPIISIIIYWLTITKFCRHYRHRRFLTCR